MLKKTMVLLVSWMLASAAFANHNETECTNMNQNNAKQYYLCCDIPYVSQTTSGKSESPGLYWVYVSSSNDDCSQFNMTGSTSCSTTTYGNTVYTHSPTSLAQYVGGSQYCTVPTS